MWTQKPSIKQNTSYDPIDVMIKHTHTHTRIYIYIYIYASF